MTAIQSLPYHPDPAKCCEGCCFGGPHAGWCEFYLNPSAEFWYGSDPEPPLTPEQRWKKLSIGLPPDATLSCGEAPGTFVLVDKTEEFFKRMKRYER